MPHNKKMIQIDRFVAESKRLLGKEVKERVLWNTHVSGDAIRHFALGIGDDNPLYIDPVYGHNSPYGRQVAPPAFLTSVLYPMLRGAPMPVPLWFLAGKVSYQWFLPIIIGDELRATSKLIDLYDTEGSNEERRAFIISETCYINQDDLLIGKCIGTTACVPKSEDRLLIKRPIYKYSEKEIETIGAAFRGETRSGNRKFDDNELQVGQEIPTFVRGPLTIGDMICWKTAIGPGHQAGAPRFRQLANSPYVTEKHPVTGLPVESSQQFEDFLLTSQRGMPLPFDQGVMRFACLSPMITNWIGDNGFLNSLSVNIIAPNLYGDTTWYHGSISKRSDHPESISLKLKIIGKNQLGETTTEAEADVTLPRKEALTFHRYGRSGGRALEKKATLKKDWAKDVFESQALRRPGAIALVFGETRLTFEEVNHQANQVADHLLSIGVEANEPVALCMERSHNFIIAILGILKAGAAYVPMDSDYPQKRLDEILEDCGTQVLIVDDTTDRDFQGYSGKKIFFDALQQGIHIEGDLYQTRKTKKEDLVYIMYTSGSVGEAKGVAITQGNLSSYLLGLKETFDIDNSDICVHTASFAFSASVRQIFLPLCVGATLVIADTEQRGDPIALADLIRREGVTHWDTVPSFFSLCCDTLIKFDSKRRKELLNNRLRRIMVTGEPLAWEAPCAWNQTLKHNAKIVNLYSQTETSGTVCTYDVSKDSELVSGIVPIGLPTPDTVIYILDENQRPVSYGEVGEICVAGPRIAKGYLNRSELTADQFISHPFNVKTDSRVFKTGDLGCYLPDGNIVIKGRRDRRVKIRGFRIELEEIERALSNHSSITRAAVVASNGNGHETRLLAYFVSNGKPAPKQAELRTYLLGTLPEYMVPSAFVPLDALPLTPNGKVDRGALPPPDPGRFGANESYVSPSNSVELKLTEIWENILDIRPIGVRDNFFELGGHSLLAVRLIAEVQKSIGIKIPVSALFQAPSVQQLAEVIQRKKRMSTLNWTVPIQLNGSKPPLFFVHGLNGFLRYFDSDQSAYRLLSLFDPFFVDKKSLVYQRVEAIAAMYLEEIQSIQPEGPYFLSGYSVGGMIALEMAQQLLRQGHEVPFLFMLDPTIPERCKLSSPYFSRHAEPQPNIESRRSYISLHFGEISKLGARKKITYITDMIKARIKISVCNFYLNIGRPITPELRRIYVSKLYRRAAGQYFPDIYPGPVIIFQSEQRSAESDWTNLLSGELEIYNYSCNHLDFMEEPHIEVWAQQLNICFQRVQKTI